MKPIMLTQEAKDKAFEIFKKLLSSVTDNADLKISITSETLLQEQNVQKPTVYVMAAAYVKMITLINSSDKELAWYGIASRVDSNYLIEDILVYPQTVTNTTVDADEEKCAKWFMELPDDTINNLRFQGHSHVNMGASPSGRDTDNWLKFANLLKPNEFMILCIGNKRGEFYWNIYDKAINVLFENKDVTMSVIDSQGESIVNWAKDSIDKYIAKEPTITLNNTAYNVIKTINTTAPVTKTTKTTKASDNKAYEKGISHIPAEFKGEIDYEPETDTYYTDIVGLPAFMYNHLFGNYMCPGFRFRAAYAKTASTKDKKEKKNK